MGGTKKPNPQNKNWEKERRDRLNKAFENLAKKLPNYSASWSKIDILQKSLEYIVEMEDKHQPSSGTNDAEWKKQVQEQEERLKVMILQNDQLMARLKDANLPLSSEVATSSPTKKSARPRKKKRKPMAIKMKISKRQTRIERVKTKDSLRVHTNDVHYSSTKILTRQRRTVVTMNDKEPISIVITSTVATLSCAVTAVSTQSVQNMLTSNVSVTPSPFLTTPIMTTGIFISHNNKLLSVPVVPVHRFIAFTPPATVATPLKKRGRKSKKQLSLINFYQQHNIGKVAIPALKRNRVILEKKKRKRKAVPAVAVEAVSKVPKVSESVANAATEVNNKENCEEKVVEAMPVKSPQPETQPKVQDDMSSDEENMESEISLNLSQSDDLLFASESLSPTAKYLMTFPLVARVVESSGKITADDVLDDEDDEIIEQEIKMQEKAKEKATKDELLNLENLTSFLNSDMVLDTAVQTPTTMELSHEKTKQMAVTSGGKEIEKETIEKKESLIVKESTVVDVTSTVPARTSQTVSQATDLSSSLGVNKLEPAITETKFLNYNPTNEFLYNPTLDMVPLPLTPSMYPMYSSITTSAQISSKANVFDYNFRSMSKYSSPQILDQQKSYPDSSKINLVTTSSGFPNFTFALTSTSNYTTGSNNAPSTCKNSKNFTYFPPPLPATTISSNLFSEGNTSTTLSTSYHNNFSHFPPIPESSSSVLQASAKTGVSLTAASSSENSINYGIPLSSSYNTPFTYSSESYALAKSLTVTKTTTQPKTKLAENLPVNETNQKTVSISCHFTNKVSPEKNFSDLNQSKPYQSSLLTTPSSLTAAKNVAAAPRMSYDNSFEYFSQNMNKSSAASTPIASTLNNNLTYNYNKYPLESTEKTGSNLAAFTFSLTSSTNTASLSKNTTYPVTAKLTSDLLPKTLQRYYGLPEESNKNSVFTLPEPFDSKTVAPGTSANTFTFSLTTSTVTEPKFTSPSTKLVNDFSHFKSRDTSTNPSNKNKKVSTRDNAKNNSSIRFQTPSMVKLATESVNKFVKTGDLNKNEPQNSDQSLKTPTKSNVYGPNYTKQLKSNQLPFEQTQSTHMPSSIYDVNWLTSELPIIPPLDFTQPSGAATQSSGNSVVAANFYPPIADNFDSNIYSNRKSDVYFAHPPEDTWSPNKMSTLLDNTTGTSNNYFTPTLPNLHGDLALNTMPIKGASSSSLRTSHHNQLMGAYDSSSKTQSSCALLSYQQKQSSVIKDVKSKEKTTVVNASNNNPSFSVRQLVESGRSYQEVGVQNLATCKATATIPKLEDFRKPVVNLNRSQNYPSTDMSYNYQASSCKQTVVPNNYSAESLIATKKDQKPLSAAKNYNFKSETYDPVSVNNSNYPNFEPMPNMFHQNQVTTRDYNHHLNDQSNYHCGNNYKYDSLNSRYSNQNFIPPNYTDGNNLLPPAPVTMFSNHPPSSTQNFSASADIPKNTSNLNYHNPYKHYLEDFGPPPPPHPPIFASDKKNLTSNSKGKPIKKSTKSVDSTKMPQHAPPHHTSSILNYDYVPPVTPSSAYFGMPSTAGADEPYNYHNFNYSANNGSSLKASSDVSATLPTVLHSSNYSMAMQTNNTAGVESMGNPSNTLANFNLSTICPEINDKVRQQNW